MLKSPKLPSVVWVITSNDGQFVVRARKPDAKKTMCQMIRATKQWPEVLYTMGHYVNLKEIVGADRK